MMENVLFVTRSDGRPTGKWTDQYRSIIRTCFISSCVLTTISQSGTTKCLRLWGDVVFDVALMTSSLQVTLLCNFPTKSKGNARYRNIARQSEIDILNCSAAPVPRFNRYGNLCYCGNTVAQLTSLVYLAKFHHFHWIFSLETLIIDVKVC